MLIKSRMGVSGLRRGGHGPQHVPACRSACCADRTFPDGSVEVVYTPGS